MSDAVGKHSILFGERFVEKVATMPLLEWHVVDVRQSDLLGLVRAMASIIKEEQVKDQVVEFVLNASSSTKTAAFAASLIAD